MDFDKVVALVVTTGTQEQQAVIGGGRYARFDGPRGLTGEIALAV